MQSHRRFFPTKSRTIFVSLSLTLTLVAGCSSSNSNESSNAVEAFGGSGTGSADAYSGPSTEQLASAVKVCDEAKRQLTTASGGGEVQIRSCKAQSDGAGNVALTVQLNDFQEWTTLLATQSMEDVLFTIPLGLVTYAFGVSGQDPLLFPAILIAFDDANRTVYEFRGSDLKETLTAQTREDADNALLILRDKISITTGS